MKNLTSGGRALLSLGILNIMEERKSVTIPAAKDISRRKRRPQNREFEGSLDAIHISQLASDRQIVIQKDCQGSWSAFDSQRFLQSSLFSNFQAYYRHCSFNTTVIMCLLIGFDSSDDKMQKFLLVKAKTIQVNTQQLIGYGSIMACKVKRWALTYPSLREGIVAVSSWLGPGPLPLMCFSFSFPTKKNVTLETIFLAACRGLLLGVSGFLFSTRKYAREEKIILAAPKPNTQIIRIQI